MTRPREPVQAVLRLGLEHERAPEQFPRRLGSGLGALEDSPQRPRIYRAGNNISETVMEIYGPNSPEYQRSRHYDITHTSVVLGGLSDAEYRRAPRPRRS